jgi:predicted RNase H-like HicB family nuclease
MLQRTYKVEFETDPETKQVTAKLPTLNHTADFGETAEEALANLRKLASGFIEVILDEGKEVPPSDKTEKGGVFLSISLETKAGSKAKRARR